MLKATLVLILAALLLIAFTAPAHAATVFTVNSTADLPDKNPGDGKCATGKKTCTLRAAIQESNAFCGGDYGCEETIKLPAGTFTLTRVGNDDTASKGDLDITGFLTIEGAGAASSIIDGNAGTVKDRVIHVLSSYPPAQFVTLKGVTVQNGKSDRGGGIYNEGGHLELRNSQILSSVSTDQGGGGIQSNGLSLDLINSTIAFNTAKGTFGFGGGVFNKQGNLTIKGSTIFKNKSNGTYSDGGGINISDGTASISDSDIRENTSTDYGGGLRLSQGTLVMSGTQVKDNYAELRGGGIYISSHNTFSLSGGTVTGNMADINVGEYGGGLFLEGETTIAKTKITNNNAPKGGGIATFGGPTTLTGVTLDGNTATISGGGIYHFTNDLTISRSTISRNHANMAGGGIYQYVGKLVLINSTVSTNDAKQSGGGIFVDGTQSTATASLNSVTVAANKAGIARKNNGKGGGLYNLKGFVGFINTVLADNLAYDAPTPSKSDCYGTVNSGGYNLIESGLNCSIVGTTTGNVNGTDPQLAALVGNPTQTHKIPLTSPAIDRGNPTGCVDQNGVLLAKDQRGVNRHLEGDGDGIDECDIGAYQNGDYISSHP